MTPLSEAEDGAGSVTRADPGSGASKIECRGLWKVYGDGAEQALARYDGHMTEEDLRREGLIGAVRDVNLQIRESEIFIIMGLSGSGKSTLVRCMSRLIPVTAGEMLIDSVDLKTMSSQELMELRRHRMGMVFQHFALLPHLTILRNVAFPLEIQGVERGERERRAREMIDLVGLEGREHNYPRQLSGGQQQRVGIARALVAEPDIWFLDEPFSALDPLIRREMQDEFLRLQSTIRDTVVFITHDFLEAIRLADRIAIMHSGVIDQVGTPEELVTQPATDYVANFTQDIPRAKVLTARSVMTPVDEMEHGYGSTVEGVGPIAPDERVEAFAERVVDGGKPVPVVDRTGDLVGQLHPDRVLDIVLEREGK